MTVDISLLLCTVRGRSRSDLPQTDTVAGIVEQLQAQTHKSFELVVVDGLFDQRKALVEGLAQKVGFEIKHVPPRASSPWVRMRKVAICAYRNTGIAACRSELILNLDDTCVLPENYVEIFWDAWRRYQTALGMTWRHLGDQRVPGRVTQPGRVFGFGSYPRELALTLNGYDEAFDGAQGLEDGDWSHRLFTAGLQQALIDLPGFDIPSQIGHDVSVIDKVRPIVRCCNAAWQAERVRRSVQVANIIDLWTQEDLRTLVGPCIHLREGMCGHHSFMTRCPYTDKDGFVGFAERLDPEAAVIFTEPPIIDLRRGRGGGEGDK